MNEWTNNQSWHNVNKAVMFCFRVIFLGLFACLNGSSYFFEIAVIVLLRKQFSKDEIRALQQNTKQSETEIQTPMMCISDGSKTDSPKDNTTEITSKEQRSPSVFYLSGMLDRTLSSIENDQENQWQGQPTIEISIGNREEFTPFQISETQNLSI